MQVHYPVFQAPFPFIKEHPRGWSNAEAEAFLVWFTAGLESRVAHFASHLGESSGGDASKMLTRVGQKLYDRLGHPQSSFEVKELSKTSPRGVVTAVVTNRRLTEEGLAQAIDASLLTAWCLLRDCAATLEWTVAKGRLRRKGTNYCEVGFHHPALVGFPGIARYKPLAMASEIALKVLTGELAPDAWAMIYKQFRRYSSVELMIEGITDRNLVESERGRWACELARANDGRSFAA